MKTATFSQFRNNAKKFFDAVEKGETIEIYRHGKPVALLTPPQKPQKDYWKHLNPFKINGISLSQLIIEGRKKD